MFIVITYSYFEKCTEVILGNLEDYVKLLKEKINVQNSYFRV